MATNQVLTPLTQFLNPLEGELVLGLTAVAILLLCTLIVSIKKTRKLDKQLIRMQNELKVSNSSVINIGQQLLNLEKKLNQQNLSGSNTTIDKLSTSILEKKPRTLATASSNDLTSFEQSVTDNDKSVYDKARLYLTQGDSIENIAKRCNLSHAEVSLLKALSKTSIASL